MEKPVDFKGASTNNIDFLDFVKPEISASKEETLVNDQVEAIGSDGDHEFEKISLQEDLLNLTGNASLAEHKGVLSLDSIRCWIRAISMFEIGCYSVAASLFEEVLSEKTFGTAYSHLHTKSTLEYCLAASLTRSGAYDKAITITQRRTTYNDHLESCGRQVLHLLGIHALAITSKRASNVHQWHPLFVPNTDLIADDEDATVTALIQEIEAALVSLEAKQVACFRGTRFFLMNCQAALLRIRGDVEQAQKKYKSVSEDADASEDTDLAAVSLALEGLVECHLSRDGSMMHRSLVRAEEVCRLALTRRVEDLGASHPQAILRRQKLAEIQRAAGKLTQAINTREETWSICLKSFPTDLVHVQAECDVAQAFLEGRRFSAAVKRAISVMDNLQTFKQSSLSNVFNPDDQSYSVKDLEARARSILAGAYHELSQTQQARRELDLAAEYYETKFDQDSLERNLLKAHVIAYAHDTENLEEATGQLDEIFLSIDSNSIISQLPLVRLLDLVLPMHRKTQDFRAYLDAIDAKAQILDRLIGADHPMTLLAKGEHLLQSLRLDDPEDMDIDDILATLRGNATKLPTVLGPQGPQDFLTLCAYLQLGQAYLVTGKHLKKAVELLQYVVNLRFRLFGRNHPDTVDANELLEQARKAT